MLELILQGLIEWGYGLVLETWEYFSSSVLDLMSMDFEYLKTHIPIMDEIAQILLAVGWALLLGNLVFQALKSMATGLGFEGEDPKLLFTRTFVFAFLLLASPQICEIGLDITQTVIDLLDVPDAVNVTFPDNSTFGGIAAAWILVVICGIIIVFKLFKLLVEIAERYIILAILTLSAPLAFGMGGSRNTSDIFTGWCRMFGSMCLVMVTNVIFFKMLLSVLSYVPSGFDVLPWMVLIFGIVRVAKKIDAIITRIGLNPAITGDGLGGRSFPGMLTYAVVRTVAQQFTKSAGKSLGGGGAKGASSSPPPGGGTGGPRTGPASGGAHFSGTAGRASQHSSQQNSQQQSSTNNTQSSTAHSSQTQGGDTTQFGGQQTDARQQATGTTFAGGINTQAQSSASYQNNSTRRTSVPPGMRRAASHVQGQPFSGTAGTGQPSGTSRPNAATGMRSGTAGTAAAQASRFTNTASQRVNEGSTDSRVNAAEQNNVSVGTVQQVRSNVTTPTEGRQSGTVPGRTASQGSTQTSRFTNRENETSHTATSTSESTASRSAPVSGGSPTASTPQPVSAIHTQTNTTTPAPERRQHTSETRRGRNAAAPSTVSSAEQRPSTTVRQERPSGTPQAPTKAAASSPRPGIAGSAARTEHAGQSRQAAQKQATASKTTPIARGTAGGKRASSVTTAQQERARSDARRPDRNRNGGADNGKLK